MVTECFRNVQVNNTLIILRLIKSATKMQQEPKKSNASGSRVFRSFAKLHKLEKPVCDCDFAKFCRLPPDLDVGTQQYLHKQFGQARDDSLRWRYRNNDEAVQSPDNETLKDKISIVNMLLKEIEQLSGIPIDVYLDGHSENLKASLDEIVEDITSREEKRNRISADEKAYRVF